MSKKSAATENTEIMRSSLIYILQDAYKHYKQAQLDYFNNTFFDDDGNFCIFGNCENLAERVESSKKEFLEAYDRWKNWQQSHSS